MESQGEKSRRESMMRMRLLRHPGFIILALSFGAMASLAALSSPDFRAHVAGR